MEKVCTRLAIYHEILNHFSCMETRFTSFFSEVEVQNNFDERFMRLWCLENYFPACQIDFYVFQYVLIDIKNTGSLLQ